MRWWLVLVPMLLPAADLKIDHVTVAGRDLKRMSAALETAGIPMVYGGPHANGTTEMSLCSFPDGSYLEAIAPVPNADAANVSKHEWAPFLKQDAIACAWAIRSDDLAADRRRFMDSGIAASSPVKAGRTRPDGVRLDWATMDIGGGVRGALFPFLIQDFTPRERRAFPAGKPVTSEYQGVAYVVIAVRDLDEAIARYRNIFRLPNPSRRTDQDPSAKLAVFEASPVILAQPLARPTWLDRRIEDFGEGPCAFVLRSPGVAHGTTHWMGGQIRWIDPEHLGWRLGVISANSR